ncbi:LysR family transcriptional regulator [Rhodococcus sp. A14]|nr:LysR family transcriptional regulator [Rhodococcus sp. A14]
MIGSLKLRHLRSFVVVAEELHFGRAAQRLQIAQPSLSQQIQQLESIVGGSLLHRTTRCVRLTTAGEALLERANRIVHQVDGALEDVRLVSRGRAGVLQVSYSSSVTLRNTPPYLQSFQDAFPHVRVQLDERSTTRVLDALKDGTTGVGFVRDSDEVDGIWTKTIATEQVVAVLPRSHPHASAETVSLTSLGGDAVVLVCSDAPRHQCYGPSCWPHHRASFEPRIVHRASSWLGLLHLVGLGAGFGLAPASIASVAPQTVLCVPLTGPLSTTTVQIARRYDERRSYVLDFISIALHTHALTLSRK